MCGIVHVVRKDGRPAYKAVLKRYRKQAHRGKEGYGYVAIKDDKVVSYKRAPTEHEIFTLMEKEDAPEILFHHRNPTSVPNVEEAAHPLYISGGNLEYQYYVAHNGVIRNDEDLKKEHEKLGFKYTTTLIRGFSMTHTGKVYLESKQQWNDSEAIAIESALVLDGKKKSIDTYGPAAVIVLKVKGDTVVGRYFYKNVNPLYQFSDENMFELTSAGRGVAIVEGKMYEIKDGSKIEKTDIDSPSLYKVHYGGGSTGGFTNEKIQNNRGVRIYNPVTKEFEWEDSMPKYPILPPVNTVQPKAEEKRKEAAAMDIAEYADDTDTYLHVDNNILKQQIRIIKSRMVYISSWTYRILWDEWDAAERIEAKLTSMIDDMDADVANGAIEISDELEEKHDLLTEEIQEISKYQKKISDELGAREVQGILK